MQSTPIGKTSERPRIGASASLRAVFFDTNNQLMTKLRVAMKTGDVEAALRAAHSIKGAGLFAGFDALAEAAAQVEISLRAARFDHARVAFRWARRLLRNPDDKGRTA